MAGDLDATIFSLCFLPGDAQSLGNNGLTGQRVSHGVWQPGKGWGTSAQAQKPENEYSRCLPQKDSWKNSVTARLQTKQPGKSRTEGK